MCVVYSYRYTKILTMCLLVDFFVSSSLFFLFFVIYSFIRSLAPKKKEKNSHTFSSDTNLLMFFFAHHTVTPIHLENRWILFFQVVCTFVFSIRGMNECGCVCECQFCFVYKQNSFSAWSSVIVFVGHERIF